MACVLTWAEQTIKQSNNPTHTAIEYQYVCIYIPTHPHSVVWTPELAGGAEERVVTVDGERLVLWALGGDGRAVKVSESSSWWWMGMGLGCVRFGGCVGLMDGSWWVVWRRSVKGERVVVVSIIVGQPVVGSCPFVKSCLPPH
jgi:hypothetical protein